MFKIYGRNYVLIITSNLALKRQLKRAIHSNILMFPTVIKKSIEKKTRTSAVTVSGRRHILDKCIVSGALLPLVTGVAGSRAFVDNPVN